MAQMDSLGLYHTVLPYLGPTWAPCLHAGRISLEPIDPRLLPTPFRTRSCKPLGLPSPPSPYPPSAVEKGEKQHPMYRLGSPPNGGRR